MGKARIDRGKREKVKERIRVERGQKEHREKVLKKVKREDIEEVDNRKRQR